MGAKLSRDGHDESLLISLAEDLAQHTVERTRPTQDGNSQIYKLDLYIIGLGKVKLCYEVKQPLNHLSAKQIFEAYLENNRILFLSGETLRKANVFDASRLDSRKRTLLERYVQSNLG